MTPDLADLLAGKIRDVPDYPLPGVMFKDIAPLLADHRAFAAMVDGLAAFGGDAAPGGRVDKVVGMEARGFIVAAPVAYTLGAGFVPVRKQGKLPGATYATTYDLEYGTATLEVQHDAFAPGDRVLLVDDVLATGGTALAAAELVRQAGGVVVGVAVLIELAFLGGRARLADLDLKALITVA
ncbi:adenine phosphoribosyltransferase [Acidothermaceae bacterium B102]|nr:adenine phosphoribosyltransferase [Acidothermaceae bacterium B102]